MKKLFAVLFCTLMITSSVFADELSYEINPVLTAKAPWKAGEKIIKEGSCKTVDYYREFLGITVNGAFVVQDFYLGGEKLTDPFLLMTARYADVDVEGECWQEIDGIYTEWHRNGQKWEERTYEFGEIIGIWREWDEGGRLVKERDLDTDPL